MGQLVAATKTPFTHARICQELHDAWVKQLGGEPKNSQLAVLCAQIALETADGTACICSNVANYKRYGSWDWCQFQTTEYDDDGNPHVLVQDFAAFPSLEVACEEFIHSQYTRWALAWHSVILGDPAGYAQGLHTQQPPYYSGPVADYIDGCRHWFKIYMTLLGPDKQDPDATAPAIVPEFILPDETKDDPQTD